MKRRIFWSVCLASVASLLLFGIITVGIIYYTNLQKGWNNLSGKAYYLSAAYNDGTMEYLTKIRGYSGRITLVDTDGKVLFDDKELPENMENHKDRPEIQQAMEEGIGKATRASDTLGQETLYYALRLEDGTILRVSESTASVFGQTAQLIPWLLLVVVFLGLISGVIARYQTKAIINPINDIDLDKPFEAEAYGELSPLLRRIGELKELIRQQIQDLRLKQKEFDLITQNMDEGLVVVNRDGMFCL